MSTLISWRMPVAAMFVTCLVVAGCCRNGFRATYELDIGSDTLADQSPATLTFTPDCHVVFAGRQVSSKGTYSVDGDLIATHFAAYQQHGPAGADWRFRRSGTALSFEHPTLKVSFHEVAR